MLQRQLEALLKDLCSLDRECEWVEFKSNHETPDDVGKYISALANGACYHKEQYGYLVFGISDDYHELKGTTYSPKKEKGRGNEELENWLTYSLSPRIDFQIHEFKFDDKDFVIFRVPAAKSMPVEFNGIPYIRVGTYRKNLKEHPEKLRHLWNITGGHTFEKAMAASELSEENMIKMIDYPKFFNLLKLPLPERRSSIIEKLLEYKIIQTQYGQYSITNCGALSFALEIEDFEDLKSKTPKVITYKGNDRTVSGKEQIGKKGYAVGFEGLIGYIMDALPSNEILDSALRRVESYPMIAIRELVANAMIHQDLETSGAFLMVEIFNNRVEITNPGQPLINPLRFVDHNSQSRNEILADNMRQMGICERRGSGYDKVLLHCELNELPAPSIVVGDNYTRVTLQRKSFKELTREEKNNTCYFHACLLHQSGKVMTNETLRERFKISSADYREATAIINECIGKHLIKQEAEGSRKYVPWWA